MAYDDAAQLCLRLYSVTDGVPPSFLEQLTRQGLADAFAELARSGWVRGPTLPAPRYRASFHDVTDRGHWIDVIASIFKRGGDVVDLARGDELVRQIGFD